MHWQVCQPLGDALSAPRCAPEAVIAPLGATSGFSLAILGGPLGPH